MKLIDADRLLDILNDNRVIYVNELKGTYFDGVCNGLEAAITCVEHAPVIEERKYGRWRFVANMLPYHLCSVCGRRALFDENSYDTVVSNYCPHCGAVMDEEAHHGK